MPTLPLEDFSPLRNAISQNGEAQGIRFRQQFDELQDQEKTRQAVAGAVQGVGEIVGTILKEANTETGKKRIFDAHQEWDKRLAESIANGKSQFVDGKLTVDPELQSWYASYKDTALQGIWAPEVKNWITGQLDDMYQTGVDQAIGAAMKQGVADRQAAAEENLNNAVNSAIGTYTASTSVLPKVSVDAGQYDEREAAPNAPAGSAGGPAETSTPLAAAEASAFAAPDAQIDSMTWLAPAARDLLKQNTHDAIRLGAAQKTVISLASDLGYNAASSWIDSSSFSEDQRTALRKAALTSMDDAMARAKESATSAYSAAAQDPAVVPDQAIKSLISKYPEWMRATLEPQLRQIQSANNLAAGTAQFNQDRDNPILKTLIENYQAIQNDPDYLGDEHTRSTVMSWYEGLISGIRSQLPDQSDETKKANEDACKRVDTAIVTWQEGKAGVTGYSTLSMIQYLENDGKLTATQANQFRDRIVSFQFPQAKPFLDRTQETAMSILGFGKKKFYDLSAADQTRVSVFQSTLTAKLADKLMEQGGDITAQRIGEIFEQAKAVATARELDAVRVGWSPFTSDAARTEAAVARSKAAIDSPAGREAVFSDVYGNTQYLSGDPTAFSNTIEQVAQWERDTLESRGIHIASSGFEPEDTAGLDITGSKIYTATDGKQYRFFSENGKMVAYVRPDAKGSWKALPVPAAPAPVKAPPATSSSVGAAAPASGPQPSVHSYSTKRYRPSDTGAVDTIQDRKTNKYITWNPAKARWEDADGNPVDVMKD